MQAKSKIILGAITAVIVVLILSEALAPNSTPDSVQIEDQLQSAAAAANDKDVDGIMSITSQNYSDSDGDNPVQLAVLLRRGMSNVRDLDVTIAPPTVEITSDHAVTNSYVTVVADGQTVFNQLVTLNWQKEATRRYFVIPDKVWRVTHSNFTGGLGSD